MFEIELGNKVSRAACNLRAVFGMRCKAATISVMQMSRLTIGLALAGGVLSLVSSARAQNAFSPGGNDYSLTGGLPGDQTAPKVAISAAGGYAVWQDNAADSSGLGIRATRLDANLNHTGPIFRVNSIVAGDQEKPQVAALTNGGAVFVWQGGQQGFQKIFARFLPAAGTNFLSTDILVNTYTNSFQINPSVATLKDGSVIVIWSSAGQDGSLQGVFGQRLSAAGTKIGGEFQINQFALNNQRTPSVAALAGGGFVVSWVSELQRGLSTVDIYARIFDASGTAAGNEFPVNTVTTNICANPSVAASPNGGFAIAWSQRDQAGINSSLSQLTVAPVSEPSTASWDVFARIFKADGTTVGLPFRLNTMVYGDQYAPKISAFGASYLAVWMGLGQDGSMEGIYGQFFSDAGSLAGVEFQVNTGNVSRQLNPVVCSDGMNRFLVAWSSYSTSGNSDLFAREY
ncbi:MAG: hypothetical protein RLY20_2923, partial [Verrucomicrobiota bacterium]